jgi:hypothetical protein
MGLVSDHRRQKSSAERHRQCMEESKNVEIHIAKN